MNDESGIKTTTPSKKTNKTHMKLLGKKGEILFERLSSLVKLAEERNRKFEPKSKQVSKLQLTDRGKPNVRTK